MYYPFFRGKQYELILLRDNAEFLSKNKIHPIIEPVKNDFTALIKAIKALHEKNVNCTLIINPQAGDTPVQQKNILQNLIEDSLKDYNNISIGYILNPRSNINDLVKLITQYKNFSFSILHYGYSNGQEVAKSIIDSDNVKTHIFIDGIVGKLYQRNFKRDGYKRILIRDGFKTQKKNAHYPPSEHFSDLHITFEDEGMDGFGDFLIVGGDYTEAGGPAYAVAIHLTYLNHEKDMFIYHFISEQRDSPTDPGGKFFEALAKLVNEVNKSSSLIFKSKACIEYLDLFKKKHYPGLGYLKKLSMQHHLELIANFMNQVG